MNCERERRLQEVLTAALEVAAQDRETWVRGQVGDDAALCRDVGACDVDCGGNADCTVDCRGAERCDVTCRGNAACEIDCIGAGDCGAIECRGAAECLLRCRGAVSCGYGACTAGAPQSCGDGVMACNRPCP